jgi:hypothetical protein
MRYQVQLQHPRITRPALTPDCGSRLVPVIFADWMFEKNTGTELIAVPLSTGAPELEAPPLVQIHTLAATGISAGAPTLGTPVLGVPTVYPLTATGLSTGSPTLGAPALGQSYTLTAQGLGTGSPTLGTPAMTQRHALTCTTISAGAPELGAPELVEGQILIAVELITGDPELGAPAVWSVPPEEWVSETYTATSGIAARAEFGESHGQLSMAGGSALIWQVEFTSDSRSRWLSTSPLTGPS